jgi:hypothetical protein
MAGLGNPLQSPTTGAAGDLGLGPAAQQSAEQIAELARKKKLQQQKDLANAGSGGMPSAAFSALTGIGSV